MDKQQLQRYIEDRIKIGQPRYNTGERLLESLTAIIDKLPEDLQTLLSSLNEYESDLAAYTDGKANGFWYYNTTSKAVTKVYIYISSYSSGVSNFSFVSDSNDGWDVALLAAPTSSQKPSGVTLVDCEYKIDFWNTGTKTAIDSGTITANDTFNTGANGEGVYEVVCKYNFSDGSHFRIRGLYRVDAADTIIASILMGGINVNSVSGLDMNVSAIITQVGCLYTPLWVAFDASDNGTPVGTGTTADITLPATAVIIAYLIDFDSTFSGHYNGDNAVDATTSIS